MNCEVDNDTKSSGAIFKDCRKVAFINSDGILCRIGCLIAS